MLQLQADQAMHTLRLALKSGAVTQADVLKVLHEEGEKFPSYAADVAQSDELEVDSCPLYSKSSDGGVWVGAWVWVADPESEG